MNTNRRNMPYNPNNPGVRQNMPDDPNKPGVMQNLPYRPDRQIDRVTNRPPAEPLHGVEQGSEYVRHPNAVTRVVHNNSPEFMARDRKQESARQARTNIASPASTGVQPQPRLAPMVNEQTYPNAGGGRSQAAAGYSKQFTTSSGRDAWGKNFDEAFQRKYDLMERGQDMGFDTSARGQDHDMFRHADDHGLKTQMHELTGRMHDENLGFKQGQHEDNYAHARAQLNQQGTQFDKTFNREGERHGIEDKRYDDKDYEGRQQLETTNEEARRRLEMDEATAMSPSLVTTYDEHGQRQSRTAPGLERGQDGRLAPPQAPQVPGLLDLDSLTPDQLELQRKQLRELLGIE